MHGLFDKLHMGRSNARLDPLEAAEARIGELTEALQGLVDLSDSSRSRDFAEVKRLLAHARRVLSDPSHRHPIQAIGTQVKRRDNTETPHRNFSWRGRSSF
jgi:hypothetical protein